MRGLLKNRKIAIVLCVMVVVGIVAGLAACAPKANKNGYGNPTVNVKAANEEPTPDKYGLVKADQWKDAYPYEYESYLANATNTPPKEDYIDGKYAANGASTLRTGEKWNVTAVGLSHDRYPTMHTTATPTMSARARFIRTPTSLMCG